MPMINAQQQTIEDLFYDNKKFLDIDFLKLVEVDLVPDSEADKNKKIETWLLVIFAIICISAIIVCIVILVIYKMRRNRDR